MEYPPERYILILIIAVGPIFLGTALDMPLLTVIWTGGLVAVLIVAIPFIIVNIMKRNVKPSEDLEKQIQRVRATLPIVPPTLRPTAPVLKPPPVPPNPITEKRVRDLIERDTNTMGHAPTIAIKNTPNTKK